MTVGMGRCFTAVLLLQFFLISALIPAARADIVSTETLLESTSADQTRQTLQSAIAREDVRAELVRLGVDPADAEKRLAELSAEELRQLQHKMDQLPAGGNVLAIIGVVFLVLLILELVGVTNVFTKI
ncbi:MAG: PA2779 family protein [Desulfopila sp.]